MHVLQLRIKKKIMYKTKSSFLQNTSGILFWKKKNKYLQDKISGLLVVFYKRMLMQKQMSSQETHEIGHETETIVRLIDIRFRIRGKYVINSETICKIWMVFHSKFWVTHMHVHFYLSIFFEKESLYIKGTNTFYALY